VINKPIISTTLSTDWFTIFSREREIFLERKRRKQKENVSEEEEE